MPIHDWSRFSDGMFHWFHQRWVGTLCDWLNAGQLPQGFYAIGELYADGYYPDVLAVEDRPQGNAERAEASGKEFGVAVAELPPKTRFTWEAEMEGYLSKKDFLAIHNVEGILVAAIEIVSPGNKSSQARLRKFVNKTIDFLDKGVHVLVVDLFPPTPRDPSGMHQAIWSERYDGEFEFHPDKPLTLASYMAASEDTIPKAFVEPIALGETLPVMPLFLWPGRYINVELEATYQGAWAVYPAPLKPKIE
jgi:hypothetical protein